MKLLIEFDTSADIVEVPQFVIDQKDSLRRKFLNWLYDKNSRHKYRIQAADGSIVMCYRSDAFVEWLNKKVIKDRGEKARILEERIWDYPEDLPSIFF